MGDDVATSLEAGHYSSVGAVGLDPPAIDTKPKNGSMGVKRSFSANGGVSIPIPTRTVIQQQQSVGQRVMAASYGMNRTASAGRSEATSLLGEKSVSAVASSTTQTY